MSGLKKKKLPHGWIVVPSKTYPDRVFFYNTVTNCSTWKNPCQATESERSYTAPKKHKINISKDLSLPTKRKKKETFQSPDCNSNVKVNNDIEDYDELQEQYFDNVSSNPSKLIGTSSSPDSTSFSDSDMHGDSNTFFENQKKKLWVHFVSSPEKPSAKKSVALSDLDTPSTSMTKEMVAFLNQKKPQPNYSPPIKKSESRTLNESQKKPVSSSKKKKGKKKKSAEKVYKNVEIKKSDKTPAQTSLLTLRQENSDRIKQLAADYAAFKKSLNESSNVKNSIQNQKLNENVSNSYLKEAETCSNFSFESVNQQEVDYSEAMDWEPSTEESDVRNINVFRQQVEKASEVSNCAFSGLNLDYSSNLPTYSLVLVLDTNIFVSCLSFVKELRDTQVSDLGYPVIYIPWRVLQELDRLKDSKIGAVQKNLHLNVRKAITYLNENFKSRHPRIFGQSFENFSSMIDVNLSAPDDEILQTCIQLQKLQSNMRLILLTNDKNLESKAIVSGVNAHSKDSFEKKFLHPDVAPSTFSTSLNVTNNERARIDDCFCEIKSILKDFMSLFLKTEMEAAFEHDWIKLVFRKPPWTLQDAMDCLLRHWRSVFFLNFTRETFNEVEQLNNRLFKKETDSIDDIAELIKITERLFASIKKCQKNKRPYMDLIPETSTKLSNAMYSLSSINSFQNDTQSSIISPPNSFPTQSLPPVEPAVDDVTKVKLFFKNIWDSLRSFCCSISDVIPSLSACNAEKVQEIRLTVSHTLNEVGELVTIVEQILEVNSTDISEQHSLIIYFSNFLIQVFPAMVSNLKHELPKCLVAFFKDFEGRSLLSCSLKDFREFIQDLMKAIEYFNSAAKC